MAENRTPLEDPNAELERQELFNQLAATETRASKLEEQYKESVKKARLEVSNPQASQSSPQPRNPHLILIVSQAEQQTLEDVEEIIQGLEDVSSLA